MLRAGSGIARSACADSAGREAACTAQAGLGAQPAEVALLFAAPDYGPELPRALRAAREVLGTSRIAGSTASGVLAAGEDAESEPAVAILALAGGELEPFLLEGVGGREREAGAELAARLGGRPAATDLVVLLPDPTAVSPRPLLAGVAEALGPAVVVGAAAANGRGGAAQWCGGDLVGGGLAGLLVRGERAPEVRITQACRPVTGLLPVTKVSGHWVLSIDGRPALDVYREVARGPLAADLRHAAAFLMVALPAGGAEALERGRYRTRRVVGFSEERGAFALPEAVGRGQEIAFVLRDASAAREALGSMLGGLPGPLTGRAALYLDCTGRGRALFGVSGLEAGYLASALPGVAWAGMQGPSQIAPLGPLPACLTYAGVLALFG